CSQPRESGLLAFEASAQGVATQTVGQSRAIVAAYYPRWLGEDRLPNTRMLQKSGSKGCRGGSLSWVRTYDRSDEDSDSRQLCGLSGKGSASLKRLCGIPA